MAMHIRRDDSYSINSKEQNIIMLLLHNNILLNDNIVYIIMNDLMY